MDLSRLADELTRSGLDVVAAGSVGAYHRAVPASLQLPWPDDRMIVLIGSSRAVWPRFLEALAAEPERRSAAHPFDGWAVPRIEAAVDAACPGAARREVYHYFESPPRRVALQHLAEVLGVAGRAPCGLSVHPTLGLWLAFRAAVVVDVPSPAGRTLPPEWPCARCEGKPCVPALERALAATQVGGGHESVRQQADHWIAVRDACPVGRDARYSEGQIAWHYRHDREALNQSPASTP